MAWTYWNWVMCNILVGFGIILFTYFIAGILLWRFNQTFYSMTDRLFNITRCIIDVNHKIVRRNSEIFTTSADAVKVDRVVSRRGSCCEEVRSCEGEIVLNFDKEREKITALNIKKKVERETTPNAAKILSTDPIQNQLRQHELDQTGTSIRNLVQKSDIIRCCWPRRVGENDQTVPSATGEQPTRGKEEVSKNHPSHPEYEREVLNVYGKFLTLNKKSNKILVMTLAVIVISSVIIAGFQGCFLANITVYPNGSCPYQGVMECYHGSNFTYFQCTPNRTINFPLFSSSATCFRWIGRDTTISEVMTQIGASTGLLTALGSVVQVLLRLLLFVFQQRPSVAAGIRRLMEKTVGINRITKPFRCCGCTLPFNFGVLDLRLYQRPWLVTIFFIVYACIPATAVASIILLSHFRISITSLTYVILIAVVMICCLGLLWILWEEDEIGKIIPGGWISISDMSGTVTRNLQKSTNLVNSVVPEKDLKDLHNFPDDAVNQLTIHTNEILDKLTSHTEDVIAQLTRRIESTLPISEVEKLARLSQDISSDIQVFKQLKGASQEIRTTQEAESLPDVDNIVSRRNLTKDDDTI